MKWILPIFLLLLFGCLGPAPQPLPEITDNGDGWSEYNGFASFEFPARMEVSHNLESYDLGRGTASVSGQDTGNSTPDTGNRTPTTLFALGYSNTTQFGQFNGAEPEKTVKDALAKDSLSDPMGMLNNAEDVSTISSYRSGSAYISELVFSLEVLGPEGDSKLSGYAIDLYFPEKSALYRYRVLSEDANLSTEMKERFMESFEG